MNLFVYGTLCHPAVLRVVTGRVYPSEAARAAGFVAYRLRDEVYPGLVHAEGQAAHGRLLRGLSDAVLERLDRFEGEAYERRTIRVIVRAGRRAQAWTYLLRPDYHSLLSNEAWSLKDFGRYHLGAFLQDYKGFGAAAPSSP